MKIEDIKAYCKDPKNQNTVNVGMFILLIISFHFLYLGWQALGYWPIQKWVDMLMVWSVDMVYSQSCWVLDHVFHIDLTTISPQRMIAALDRSGGWARIVIAPECASLKQWMHWLFLMLIFPGPWKHKAWYIPLGLVIVEFTNVVRVVGITLFLKPFPHHFDLAHNYIFKIMFYVVIFLMWVIWTEKFYHPKTKKSNSTQPISPSE